MDNIKEKILRHMDYWQTTTHIKPDVRFPFAYTNFNKLGLKGGYLASHVFYYEGSVQGRTSDGGGYPWVIINVMNMKMGVEDIDISEGLLTHLHGQEWKIEPSYTVGEISLHNFEGNISNLEPGKFYCLDTGKMLDLEKIRKLSHDK